jgi:hypothetical protein
LQHQLQKLRCYRFGKGSERFIDPENQQLDFFKEDPATFSTLDKVPEPAEDQSAISIVTQMRKKKAPKELADAS